MTAWLEHNLKERTLNNKVPFQVTFNFKPFSPKPFKDEVRDICLQLHQMYGEKLFLAFSGGADSEFILKTFIEMGLPIAPVIVSCPYNQHDIAPAFAYCEANNVRLTVLEYGAEYINIAKEKIYNRGLISPIGLTPLLVYDHVRNTGGKVVSGQGEPLPITLRNKDTQIGRTLQMFEFEFYMDHYASDPQPAPFYCYNQGIFYSYLTEIDTTLELEEAKCKLYGIPSRKKTYWVEEIYADIRKNMPVMPSAIKCDFSCDNLLLEIQKFIR